MNQKFKLLPIWLLFTLIYSLNTNSQTTNDSIFSPVKRSNYKSKELIGFWQLADSTNQIVEFVDESYQVVLKNADINPYYFSKDSTGHIYSSGYFPMWPPPGCDLELISKDSLMITFSPFFNPGKPILYLRKKNGK